MMKSGDRCSLAVRTEDGIVIDNTKETSLRKRYKICNIPVIRGCVSFVEQLFSAMKMLTKSADMQGIDLDEPETKFEKWLSEKLGDKLMAVVGGIGMILGIILAMGLFLLLPTYTAKGIDWLTGGFVSGYSILFSVIEGLIRIGIFVAYVWLVSFMPDIRKTYEYHGAEHKSVDCFEKGLPLTPENAKTCTRFHPRCGTSFIFVVLIISIIVNSFFEIDNTAIRFASKLLTVPLIVGVGFEFIKYAGGHNNVFTKILSAPGLWMQNFTTNEPDDDMIEVGITAVQAVLPREEGADRW
jgi:uncharacterized protein YqhQ